MKKIFSFIAALMAVVAMNATVVTITPDNCGWSTTAGAQTGTAVDGVTASVTKGMVGTAGGFTAMRIYKGETLTISCTKEISAVVFTCTANDDAQYGPGCFAAQDGYSYATKFGTWTGTAATSVTFVASTNQVRATKIEVYLDGEIPAAQTTVKATVAEAIAAGMALDSMATSDAVYEVTGYVVNSQPYSSEHGNQIWFMADDAANTANQVFEAYACVAKEDGEIKQVVDGDKVVLTGSLTKYYDKSQSKFIVEIKNGNAAFVTKAEGDHDLQPVVVDTITVAEALALGKALPAAKSNNQKSAEVVVKGFVVKAYAANEGFTDQTWYMADEPGAFGEFEAYRCTPDRTVEDGDYVYVRGRIVNFGDESKSTIEISNGTATHGEAPEIVVTEVSVAEAITIAQTMTPELKTSEMTSETYAVKGFIVKVKDAEKKTYYMADQPGAFGDFQAFQCASIDYEVAEGDYVIVTGKISTYHGEGSDGEYYSYEIAKGALKHVYGQGIENVVMTEKAQKVIVDGVLYIVRDGKMFNVQGAQVR